MSRPETAPHLSRQVDAATARLDRALRRLHLTTQDRRSVLAEVRTDLDAAAADGVPPETLIGPDPDAFAREAVAAGGHSPRPRDYGRVLAGGLAGAVAALVAGYLLISYVLLPVFTSLFDLDGHYPVLGVYVAMSGIALAGTLGVLGVLALVLQGRPAAGATVSRAALLVPVAAAAGVAVLVPGLQEVEVPWATARPFVLVSVVVLLVTAALLGARVWAVQAHRVPAGRSTVVS